MIRCGLGFEPTWVGDGLFGFESRFLEFDELFECVIRTIVSI